MFFKQNPLKKIQTEIAELKAKKELEIAQKELAALKDAKIYKQLENKEEHQVISQLSQPSIQEQAHESLVSIQKMLTDPWNPQLRHSHGQESIIDTLYGIPSLRALTGYTNLIQIPFMVRESFPYKQTIVRNIVQLDFIRFIGRLLFEECPTFSTAVEAMRCKVFGDKGLKIQAYSLKEGENEELVEELNNDLKEMDDYNDFKEWQKECFVRYHVEGECFLNVFGKNNTNEELPEIRMIEPDFIRPSVLQGQGHEDPRVSGGMGEDWSFGINDKPYSWYRPQKYQVVYPPEWDKEEVIKVEDMFHAAYRDNKRNIKRGIPTCFRIVDDLVRITVLREALTTGAIQRARIAGVVKYETNIDTGYVETDLEKLAQPKGAGAFNFNPTYSWHDNDEQAHFIGLIKGRDFVDYPSFDANSAEVITRMGIQVIAGYYKLPLSVFGLAEEHSYSAGEVAESTQTTARREDQGFWSTYWERVAKRLLEKKRGDLDWKIIGIEVTGPSMEERNIGEEVAAHTSMIAAKIESRAQAQSDMGLDPQDQDDQMENDPIQIEKEENDLKLETESVNKETNENNNS